MTAFETKPICPRWAEETIPKAFGLEAATRRVAAERAKQTQFPASKVPHHSSIPIRCLVCETKPIPASVPIGRSAFPGGEIVRNKPNFPPGPDGARPGGRGAWGFAQTNPIPAIMPIRRSAVPGGQIVRNKANSSIADFGLRIQGSLAAGHPHGPPGQGRLYKQTQLARANRGKQSQTWAGWGIWGPARGEPIVRNEANWPPGRCRARTPNSRSGRGRVPRRAGGRSCETKPILRKFEV